MIKINLSTEKKIVDIANIGGIDFTKIKIKLVLLMIFLIYVPDFVLYPIWEADIAAKNLELENRQSVLNGLQRKVAQNQNFEKQIRELKAQEENFGKKLLAVKEAISEKKNPSSLLLYISKNIPEAVWITELSIEGNMMTIKGESLDYSNIGLFANSVKTSVFIRDLAFVETKTLVKEGQKITTEYFEFKCTIGRFDQ